MGNDNGEFNYGDEDDDIGLNEKNLSPMLQVLKEQARLSRESARERKAREPFS